MKIDYMMNINTPIERVFEYLSDPEKMKLWMSGLVEFEYISKANPDNLVGATFKMRFVKAVKAMKFEVKLSGKIMDYEKPGLYGVKIQNQELSQEYTYRLEKTATGTQLSYDGELHFKGGGFRAKFIERMAAQQPEQDGATLKDLAEQT